jgi:hypothetical protein
MRATLIGRAAGDNPVVLRGREPGLHQVN